MSREPEQQHQIYYLDKVQHRQGEVDIRPQSIQVQVITVDNRPVDIRIGVDAKQRHEFFRHFPRYGRHWKTSSYADILQNEIAVFRHKHLKESAAQQESVASDTDITEQKIHSLMELIEGLSQAFAQLETMINRTNLEDTEASINDLLRKLEKYEQALDAKIYSYQGKIPERDRTHFAAAGQLLTDLKQKIKEYREQLIEHSQKEMLTGRQARKQFSVQNESSKIKALGALVCEQMVMITAWGIDELYRITHNRTKQLFAMHPAIKALSEAKAAAELKGLSLHGKRYINLAKIPRGMQEATCALSQPTADDAAPQKPAPKKWMSISHYLAGPDDIEGLDKMLCYFTGRKITDKTTDGFDNNHALYYQMYRKVRNFSRKTNLFLRNIVELGLSTLRLIPLVICLSGDLLINQLGIRFIANTLLGYKVKPVNWFERLEHWVADLADKYSLVKAKKENLIGKYQRLYEGNNNYIQVLDTAKQHSRSLYNEIIAHYLSGHKISQKLGNIAAQSWTTLTNWYEIMRYKRRISNQPEHRLQRFEETRREVNQQLSAKKEELLKNLQAMLPPAPGGSASHQEEKANRLSSPEEKGNDQAAVQVGVTRAAPHEEIVGEWDPVEEWEVNDITLALDFFEDIFVGLSDSIVDPMFRKSPGLATLFFILSQISWGTLLVPSMVTSVGQASIALKVMQQIPIWISKHFCGKDPMGPDGGFFTQMISIFVQWKLGFFGAELLSESARGNFEFLDELFKEPEKITLGLLVLMGAGFGLQYLPPLPPTITINGVTIPNLYTQAINIFSEEACACAHGTLPFTTLEYTFLGLKFGLLIQLLLTGQHSVQPKPTVDIKKLTKALMDAQVLTADNGADQLAVITRILTEMGIDDNEFAKKLRLELLKNITHIKQSSQSLPSTFPPSSSNGDSNQAWQQLKAALVVVSHMESVGYTFKDKVYAKEFYDHLTSLFDAYDKELNKFGRADLWMYNERREILRRFYNRHCYTGTTTLIKIISLVPFAPVTYAWRGIKYGIGKAFNMPWVVHEVKKSCYKDGALLMQGLAIGSRVLRATARAYAYMARAIVLLIGAIPFPLLLSSSYRQGLIDFALRIRPHHFSWFSNQIAHKYAVWAREAGTYHEDLQQQVASAVLKLDKHGEEMRTVSEQNASEEEKTAPLAAAELTASSSRSIASGCYKQIADYLESHPAATHNSDSGKVVEQLARMVSARESSKKKESKQASGNQSTSFQQLSNIQQKVKNSHSGLSKLADKLARSGFFAEQNGVTPSKDNLESEVENSVRF